ncbi:MAG: glutathione S-transferase [Pseudomonadota bacterium]
MTPILHIGPKNYSSWSLRPWLVLKWGEIEFAEHYIPLDQPGYGEGEIAEVKAVSPNGTVPALTIGQQVIWDSLAIAEWAAEQAPELWPTDASTRAEARSASAEMHSGFFGLRRDLPMNITRRCPNQDWPQDTARNLKRLFNLWQACRSVHARSGPWLFGKRSIADAFYAPVATRLRTYSVPVNAVCQAYIDTVLSDSAFMEWEAECKGGVWDKPGFPVLDNLYAND